MNNLFEKQSNWKSKWVVLILLIIGAFIVLAGRGWRLAEISTAHAEELIQTVEEVKQQAEAIKEQNEQLRDKAQVPTKDMIVAEIKKVFGNHSEEALQVAKCESGIADKTNINKNGTFDSNIFQINSIHVKRFGAGFIKDWKENINVAYKIFDEQNWNPWVCAHKIGMI